jgi:hypothetical protein
VKDKNNNNAGLVAGKGMNHQPYDIIGDIHGNRGDGERRLDAEKPDSVARVALDEKPFKVLVDDNFHYMDENERYMLGAFPTLEAASAACRGVVDDFLLENHKPSMTAAKLYASYTMFGDDPWIATGGEVPSFSAWDYAKQRCDEICGDGRRDAGGPGNGN